VLVQRNIAETNLNCYYFLRMSKVSTGLDILLRSDLARFKDSRVGILSHQASVDSRLSHIISLLHAQSIQITALFAPEHGLWGTAQDQIPILSDDEPVLNVPIFSLYGNHRTPPAESLKQIDLLICDLQDVGSRYYTFIWTMAIAMQACAKQGKKFIVLDRPNPINGLTMEGPVLDINYASFVGLYPLPVRHGMTIGEIALWLNDRFSMGADLEVIRMKGWKRKMYFEQTGLTWVLPSPNMPTVDTAVVYPGACLIEGTNLSEGRGTTRPFEILGAPYVDGDRLAGLLNRDKLPGVIFRACRFEPTFHKFQKDSCRGVQIHVTDRRTFFPFLTALVLIQRVYDLYNGQFAWRPPPYEYETEKLPFDILCGTDAIRKSIEAGQPVQRLQDAWREDCAGFAKERKPFLLYN
jgi:uncharacterized protein YbbC (DUF1343 family)